MWHTDGRHIKSHCRIFRPRSIRIRIPGPNSVSHKGAAEEESPESVMFYGCVSPFLSCVDTETEYQQELTGPALDSSPFVPQKKPEPVACQRVFPNLPIPDLSEFHALVVEVPETDGKTYAIAVHPRTHPDPGENSKYTVKAVDQSLVS